MKKEDIQERLRQALKQGKKKEISVFRLLLSAIHNKEIDQKSSLSEEDFLAVVKKQAKGRHDAIVLYREGNREDLVQKEEEELEILKEFLPRPLSEKELTNIIEGVVGEKELPTMADFGLLMGQAMAKVKGRAAGDRVALMLKEKLS